MTRDEVDQHVGDAVTYTPYRGGVPKQGVIQSTTRVLAVIQFDDGSIAQCSPNCLELVPTLFDVRD